jgi:hypothetical protein
MDLAFGHDGGLHSDPDDRLPLAVPVVVPVSTR